MKTTEQNNIVVSLSEGKETRSALTEKQLAAIQKRRQNYISDLADQCYNVHSINGKGAHCRAIDFTPNGYAAIEDIILSWERGEQTAEDYQSTVKALKELLAVITTGTPYKIILIWTWGNSGECKLKVRELTYTAWQSRLIDQKYTSGTQSNAFYMWLMESAPVGRLLLEKIDKYENELHSIDNERFIPRFRSSATDKEAIINTFERLGWNAATCCIEHRGEEIYTLILDKKGE